MSAFLAKKTVVLTGENPKEYAVFLVVQCRRLPLTCLNGDGGGTRLDGLNGEA